MGETGEGEGTGDRGEGKGKGKRRDRAAPVLKRERKERKGRKRGGREEGSYLTRSLVGKRCCWKQRL